MRMNKIVKVILGKNHGIFEPNKVYQELLKSKGVVWCELKARTDEDIIKFVEQNQIEDYKASRVGKENYQYVTIVEVDTAKPWTIEEYDGSEYIQYIDYEVIDEKLNYCKLK